MRALNVIVASRSRVAVDKLAGCLSSNTEYKVRSRHLTNGHEDPLYGIRDLPDLLLLHYGPDSSELRFLAESGLREQLPIVVCGPVDDPEAMRLAMRAGARDFLPDDTSEADLLASLARVHEEMLRSRSGSGAKLVVAINGKGGSGASFLATNLAHSLVVENDSRVTLVDLDLQFGGLYRYLDLKPKSGILQAMESAQELDEVSARAFTSEHSSGLRLLSAQSKFLTMADSVSIDKLEFVMDAYLAFNDYVVADAPRKLDAVTELWLARADTILLVTQQSLPHVQDSARQMAILTAEVGIPRKKIKVVVNRWTRNSEIEMDDIRKVLRVDDLYAVPNNYRIATESINAGVPVASIARNAPITRGIRKLQETVVGPGENRDPGFLKRVMPNFLGG